MSDFGKHWGERETEGFIWRKVRFEKVPLVQRILDGCGIDSRFTRLLRVI